MSTLILVCGPEGQERDHNQRGMNGKLEASLCLLVKALLAGF